MAVAEHCRRFTVHAYPPLGVCHHPVFKRPYQLALHHASISKSVGRIIMQEPVVKVAKILRAVLFLTAVEVH